MGNRFGPSNKRQYTLTKAADGCFCCLVEIILTDISLKILSYLKACRLGYPGCFDNYINLHHAEVLITYEHSFIIGDFHWNIANSGVLLSIYAEEKVNKHFKDFVQLLFDRCFWLVLRLGFSKPAYAHSQWNCSFPLASL